MEAGDRERAAQRRLEGSAQDDAAKTKASSRKVATLFGQDDAAKTKSRNRSRTQFAS
jgi:hypothetical protein